MKVKMLRFEGLVVRRYGRFRVRDIRREKRENVEVRGGVISRSQTTRVETWKKGKGSETMETGMRRTVGYYLNTEYSCDRGLSVIRWYREMETTVTMDVISRSQTTFG
jgi:hypothetical protein